MRLPSLLLAFCIGCTFPGDLIFGGSGGGGGSGGSSASNTGTGAGPSNGGGGLGEGGEGGFVIPGCTEGDDPCDMDCDGAHPVGKECPLKPFDCDDTNANVNPLVMLPKDTPIPDSEPESYDWNCNGYEEPEWDTACTDALCEASEKVLIGPEPGDAGCGMSGDLKTCGFVSLVNFGLSCQPVSDFASDVIQGCK